jgi:3-isopropylmalate/(R)-2-methylmalate dehydratase small subunit
MKPFTVLESAGVPLDRQDVDTDQIIPARFLRKSRQDLGKYVFNDLRFAADGVPNTGFVLNDPRYRRAQILVADSNFGCGSSREAAVWALIDDHGGMLDAGLRCIIAPSFGDIFASNAAKNGLLTVRLSEEDCARIRKQLHESPGATVRVDLPQQTVAAPDGALRSFDIDPFRKECLVNGLDDFALTMRYEREILAHEQRLRAERPWLLE